MEINRMPSDAVQCFKKGFAWPQFLKLNHKSFQSFQVLIMGASCVSLFDDWSKDDDKEFELTDQERKDERHKKRRKWSLIREGPVGFEVKYINIHLNWFVTINNNKQ